MDKYFYIQNRAGISDRSVEAVLKLVKHQNKMTRDILIAGILIGIYAVRVHNENKRLRKQIKELEGGNEEK